MGIKMNSFLLPGLLIAGAGLLNPFLVGEATGGGAGQPFADPSYVAPAPQKTAETEKNAFRILFDGNSITRHGVNEDTISRLGWDHVAGMAATSENNDFAHRLGALIQKTMPDRKVELYFGGSVTKDMPHPDLVVIQTGEHEVPGKTKEKIAELYEKRIMPFYELKPRPLLLCAGIWSPSDGEPYANWARDVNDTYQAVCSKYEIQYASVERLASDPSCRGWGTSPGVKWHPNDKGMAGYADLLFAAYQRDRAKKK